MTIDEMIAVLQAAKAGKKIEVRSNGSEIWNPMIGTLCNHEDWSAPCNEPPKFNFGMFDYRVKPEPREWDIAVHKQNNRPYPPDWLRHDSENSWELVHVQEVPK
jgi:hypothetical protein